MVLTVSRKHILHEGHSPACFPTTADYLVQVYSVNQKLEDTI